ncbi:MAG TPA: site-2 protease family protein [Candidatus Acidoferrales bacterium]|nr:site-2 protease family protein [Candidatus Acidoferrales bacterium]
MKYSFKIGSVWGIPIELHFTFLLLMLAVFLLSLPSLQFYMFFLTILLFLFVVFHELAHSIVARHYGIKVRKIVLYPIGGVSEIEEITDNPAQEWRMAIAGPAVSLITGFALLVVSFILTPNLTPSLSTLTTVTGQFTFDLATLNILLGIFNLIPAFPMDGGRVFRALLAKRLTFPDATRYAVTLGKILGVAMVIIGFVFNFLLIIVGLFVYIGASEEGEETIISTKLAGVRVKDVMQQEVGRVEPEQTIKEALEVMFNNRYHDVIVEKDGALAGIVTWSELVKIKPEQRDALRIEEMPIAKISVYEDASILEANKIIITQNINLIPVVQKENPTKLVGIITSQAIANAYEQAKNR